MPCCRRTADASKRLVLKVLASRDQSPSAALEEDGESRDDDKDGDEDEIDKMRLPPLLLLLLLVEVIGSVSFDSQV